MMAKKTAAEKRQEKEHAWGKVGEALTAFHGGADAVGDVVNAIRVAVGDPAPESDDTDDADGNDA